MPPRRRLAPLFALSVASLVLCLVPAARPQGASPLRGQITWSGLRAIDGPVTIKAGATLVLAPGTRLRFGSEGTLVVEGKLAAAGEARRPVRLEGSRTARLPCVEARGPTAVIRLDRVEVSNAAAGVRTRGGTLTCRFTAFARCGTALDLDLKTRATLEDSIFESCAEGLLATNGARVEARRLVFRRNARAATVTNEATLDLAGATFGDNRQGLRQEKSSDVHLAACRFEGNDTALELHQTPRGPSLVDCTFSLNHTGVSAMLSANPAVEASSFAGNGVAVQASQFSGPVLRRCCLRGNGEAVRLDKHSDARLEGNRFEGNRVGVFADFSSYPAVSGNLFAGNDWHVRLGNFQSADWERRQGGAPVERERGGRRAGPSAPPLPTAEAAGERIFSVAGNAWDEDTAREMAEGPGANVSRFWDGRDQPLTPYRNDRGEAFALDVIRFLPSARARDLTGLAEPCGGTAPPQRGRPKQRR